MVRSDPTTMTPMTDELDVRPLTPDTWSALARDHGATTLEAYPVETAGARLAAAGAPTGTIPMFERVGFRAVATRQANQTTRPRHILRLSL